MGQAALLALRGPALGAPAPDPAAPRALLAQQVQSISFPNWSTFGWLASGRRIDEIGGHQAVTVYYSHGSRTIAYTIVALPALSWPAASSQEVAGTQFESFPMSRRLVITWRRAGETCILSGVGSSPRTLMQLAAWEPQQPAASASSLY